jgi:hypothetical protein
MFAKCSLLGKRIHPGGLDRAGFSSGSDRNADFVQGPNRRRERLHPTPAGISLRIDAIELTVPVNMAAALSETAVD